MTVEVSSAAAFLETVNLSIETAMKMKKIMLKKGLRRARTKCPKCGGWLKASLGGAHDHIHMVCDTPNCLWVVE